MQRRIVGRHIGLDCRLWGKSLAAHRQDVGESAADACCASTVTRTGKSWQVGWLGSVALGNEWASALSCCSRGAKELRKAVQCCAIAPTAISVIADSRQRAQTRACRGGRAPRRRWVCCLTISSNHSTILPRHRDYVQQKTVVLERKAQTCLTKPRFPGLRGQSASLAARILRVPASRAGHSPHTPALHQPQCASPSTRRCRTGAACAVGPASQSRPLSAVS